MQGVVQYDLVTVLSGDIKPGALRRMTPTKTPLVIPWVESSLKTLSRRCLSLQDLVEIRIRQRGIVLEHLVLTEITMRAGMAFASSPVAAPGHVQDR